MTCSATFWTCRKWEMPTDFDLVRDMLLTLRDSRRDCYDLDIETRKVCSDAGRWSIGTILEHYERLCASDLVVTSVPEGHKLPYIEDLTQKGHDFASNIASDDVWADVMRRVGPMNGKVGLDVIILVARYVVFRKSLPESEN